jgi:plastocyanin
MNVSHRTRNAGVLAGLLLFASATAVVLPAAPVGAAPIRTINGTATLRWVPNAVTVAHGTSIHWHAIGVLHRVKAYGGNWTFLRSLPAGATVTRTFGTKGVFRFYCTIHGHLVNGRCVGMCGRITVT